MQSDPTTAYASGRDGTAASHHQAVQRVIQAMQERLDESFSLRAMARVAFVSPYHFNRMFRQITGIPPCQFLYALRLEAAKRLLLTTHLSVIDVCYEVGYNSLGTFTRRFTDLLGLSPTRFRFMAQSSMDDLLAGVVDLIVSPEQEIRVGLSGRVTAPKDFHGLIFVGLFPDRIPQGKPVACALLNKPGSYFIDPIPDGRFYLFATGLSWSGDPKQFFNYESALRGGGYPISACDGIVMGETNISLRPPALFDPPILLTLPLLLANRLRQEALTSTPDGVAPLIAQSCEANLVGT